MSLESFAASGGRGQYGTTPIGMASFAVVADTSQFQAGVKQAEAQAAQFVASVDAAMQKVAKSVHTTSDTYEVLERQVGTYEVMERRVVETIKVETTMLDQLGISLSKNTGLYNVATSQAAAAGNAIGRAGQVAGGGAHGFHSIGYSILFASQAIEDLQYGLRAILNNIPLLVMSLGGSAGLAGVISIVSVGANLLYEHFGDIKAAITGTAEALPSMREGLDDVAESLKKVNEELEKTGLGTKAFHELDLTGAEEERVRKLVRMKETGEDVARDQALIGQFGPEHTEAAQRQAEAFRKGLRQLPAGAKSVMDHLIIQGGMGQWNAEHLLAEALRGDITSIRSLQRRLPADQFGALHNLDFDPSRTAKDKALAKQADHEVGRAAAQTILDLQKEELDRIEKGRREEMWRLEDARQRIEDQKADTHFAQQLKQFGKMQIFGGGAEYANAAQTGDGEIRKQQLLLQRSSDQKLREIRDELKKRQRARFE